ncbi:hypothetical protein LIA77_11221 [Sarocladium implicatum]|nr:hypothetical protein LIA77_11221 [Sarocladium implicatum]
MPPPATFTHMTTDHPAMKAPPVHINSDGPMEYTVGMVRLSPLHAATTRSSGAQVQLQHHQVVLLSRLYRFFCLYLAIYTLRFMHVVATLTCKSPRCPVPFSESRQV